MRRVILIFSALLLIFLAIQKWPLKACELGTATTPMPPIANIGAEIITSPQANLHTFFHAHRSGEFGHFHIFYTDEDQNFSHHIVGASIDENGRLIKLFVTEPWVTRDDFLPLEDLLEHITQLQGDTWIERLLKNHASNIKNLHTVKAKMKEPLIGRYAIIAEIKLQPSPHALSEEKDQTDTRLK